MEQATQANEASASRGGPGQLRIVCLEEHTFDPGLGKATKQPMAARFPFFQQSEGEYQDDPKKAGRTGPFYRAARSRRPSSKRPSTTG